MSLETQASRLLPIKVYVDYIWGKIIRQLTKIKGFWVPFIRLRG